MTLTAGSVSRAAAPRLSTARLGQLAAAMAAAPGRWSNLVRFDPVRRWYHRLALADDHEVWLLSWLPGQRTGFHDHGNAAGAFAVADGELWERTAAGGRAQVSTGVLGAGEVRAFGSRHVHDVGNSSARPAVSIHAYSPPLTVVRRYQLTSTGLVPAATDTAGLSW